MEKTYWKKQINLEDLMQKNHLEAFEFVFPKHSVYLHRR